MQHEQITQTIIGCAFKVHSALGFGFLESVYENSLVIELSKHQIRTETQQPIAVFYEGHPVGEFKPDVLVGDDIILELKSIQQLAKIHELQLVNYLVATRRNVGLLINFGPEKVEFILSFPSLLSRPPELSWTDLCLSFSSHAKDIDILAVDGIERPVDVSVTRLKEDLLHFEISLHAFGSQTVPNEMSEPGNHVIVCVEPRECTLWRSLSEPVNDVANIGLCQLKLMNAVGHPAESRSEARSSWVSLPAG